MTLAIPLLKRKQTGFSLLEVMVAMLISSVIFIAMTKTYPVLSGQILDLYSSSLKMLDFSLTLAHVNNHENSSD
ncbi:prepilin-type N-terminal cleavage/methylation domain-containing protein [Xenorhabdus bovienii]|uniref:prepilin-type N-terminal cleavage/methylation domain-containing protein n=1 Tax=Xenorhabdus bovienii TaxID=40576 RepID=UPI00237CE32D|nr:prepilin-type N-terminal cleavage/methylation domain-containing protein [Xenorhabdus bovienii]